MAAASPAYSNKTDINHYCDQGRQRVYKEGKSLEAKYVNDGHEILTYKKGDRGMGYIFKVRRRTKPLRNSFSIRIRLVDQDTAEISALLARPRKAVRDISS